MQSVKNVITLGKLIGLLLFCLPLLFLLSFLFLKTPTINIHTKNTRNELSRLVMGTIFLVLALPWAISRSFLRKIMPHGITLHAKAILPIRDKSCCFMHAC